MTEDFTCVRGHRWAAGATGVCPECGEAAVTLMRADDNAPGTSAEAPSAALTLPGLDRPAERYRAVRLHARGGLGEVHLAHDAELHRDVALKRIQARHAQDRASRARFLVEAEITAGLAHPGVVPVYGLVHDERGQPSYAMRFIEGESLEQALARLHAPGGPLSTEGYNGLAFRQLLNRFVTVCNTLAYAHSRGVIHRDLKPQNIMLGRFGETLVVDWGLAKTIGRDDHVQPAAEAPLVAAAAGSVEHTVQGQVMGTPAYMSPEQATGDWDRVRAASDVYSLGATFFALLTGKAPFQGRSVPDVLTSVAKGEFAPPRLVNHAVPRPLESICLKAMALEPEARYPSTLAFADDLDHWLADDAVSAYRPRWSERLARWGRHHKTLLASLAALLLTAVVALAAGLVLLGSKQQEIIRERNTAQIARDEAQAINRFLAEDLLAAAQIEELGRDVTVRAAVDAAAQKLDRGAFADRPEAEAALRLTLGDTYFSLGLYEKGLPHLERAVELRKLRLGPDDPATLTAMNSLGFLLARHGKLDRAEAILRQTLDARQRVLGPEHPDTLVTMSHLGLALHEYGKFKEAEQTLRVCLAAQRRILGDDHRDTLYTLSDLAQTASELNLPDAEALYRESLQRRERLFGAMHPDTLRSMSNLGWLELTLGRRAEAEALLVKSLAGRRKVLGVDHPETFWSMKNLAWLRRDQGRLDEAAALFRETLAARRRVLGDNHQYTMYSMQDLADFLLYQDKVAEAEILQRECLELRRRTLGSDYTDTLISANGLAFILWRAGMLEEAESRLRDTLRLRRQTLDANDPQLGYTLTALGGVLVQKGQTKEALPLLREAASILTAKPLTIRPASGALHPGVTRSLLGACLAAEKEFAAAEPLLLAAYQALREAVGVPPWQVRDAKERIVKLYEAWNKPEQAAAWRK